ncbi:MAG: hypothetical protein QF439_04500 [Candidatus Marinimicrobia bacterium]|jgi:hypothetical protein|nr:hypothetical protein [Candidatus Neomarinimicrobiota bacterium]HBN45976.1 hypothetical protein [Candidatus Neomarinimicrobiota bacterium]HJL75240.1 DUF4175 family protein [Candidatus Neomarinimicrobiota bacterium]|tara:strand:+ start:7899 stop:11312 length:3414 start_codon:yes stop_codon:yes gene_type:complete
MQSIEKQLKSIRNAALLNDVRTATWILYSIGLLVVISAIILEAVFYFTPEIRYGFWQLGLVVFCGAVFGIILIYILAVNNKINRYRWSTLAKAAGRLAFPKEDTIINALQLERGLETSTSRQLSKSFVKETNKKLGKLDTADLFHSSRGQQWKSSSLVILLAGVFIFSINWNNNAQAVFRWSHPRTTFPVPQPFAIQNLSGNINLLGGETAELAFTVIGEAPDSLFIDLQPYTTPDTSQPVLIAKKDSTGIFKYTIKDISQDYRYRAYYSAVHFWEVWSEISSPFHAISVTDRPVMEDLTITLTPPSYTQLKPVIQKGNQADISGLVGSSVHVSLRSNRPLKKGALIINDKALPMAINGKKATGEFIISEDGQFAIQLQDIRGISNRNPIPFYITAVQDLLPDISVFQPEPIMELGSDQIIPMHVHIEDDFGFSNLQVAYEIHRPAYIAVDPLLSLFTIPINEPMNVNQELIHVWQLLELGLMPEDEVHYHFELSDNDLISGPKKTVTNEFIARLPGLAELFTMFENKEETILDEVTYSQEELEAIRENMEQLELDILKQDELTWEQQQDLQNMLEGVREEMKKMEEIADALNSLQEAADKHDLFSTDLLEKFNHLQELIDELLSEDLMKNLQNIDEMMAEMDPKKLQDALQSLSNNLERVEQELDRFIDIFERIKAEQKMDELLTRLETLADQQEKLHDRIDRTHEQTDPSTFSKLSEEEQRQVEEFSNIRNEMEDAAEAVEKFHEESADLLEELKRDPLMNQTYADLQRTVNQLRRQNSDDALEYSASALENLQNLLNEMQNIQKGFQSATTRKMAAKFQQIMGDILNISKSQEQLQNETGSVPFNSPRLGNMAGHQQMLQDQLHQIMEQLMELSRETFAVTPEIGRGMGMSNAMMQEAINALAQRNGRGAAQQQQQAMKSLNETAMAIHQSMNQMRSSGSASGYEQFLEQMQKMAGQQQGINSQSMQLAMGQMAAAAQQGLLKKLLQEQKQVRKSLQEMMNEMKRSGEKGLGDMGGIAQEMDEVLKDFERQKISRKTVDRQQRILSRMLDSQKSMTQRGEKEERKSETATEIFISGPAGLPADMGQRRSLTMEAMNRALKAGYPRDYQAMIRRYFNAISAEDFSISPTDTSNAN